MRDAEWMHRDERADRAPEKIEKAAILFQGRVYSVFPPGRHHDVVKAIIEQNPSVTRVMPNVQGFVTSNGRFVQRDEACVIATKADQIKVKTNPAHLLFSEDVW